MKKLLLFAITGALFASCANDEFSGDNQLIEGNTSGLISFNAGTPAITRSTKSGADAAADLGKKFVVYANKHAATEDKTKANDSTVFQNYQVGWTDNSAGSTQSNTAGWDYVGLTPYGFSGTQGIKYWDYGAEGGYTFYAFTSSDISYPQSTSDKVIVTKTTTGSDVYQKGYTVEIKKGAKLDSIYFADRLVVSKSDYEKPVVFTFRQFAAKVRVAFYETIPGYSVKLDSFYYDKDATAAVSTFKAMANGDKTKFQAAVQNVGAPSTGSNKMTVTYYDATDPSTENQAKFTNNTVTYNYNLELGSNVIGKTLGTSSSTATYDQSGGVYTGVYPFEANANPMLIRCDYTLTAEDGQGEQIKIKNARVVVPTEYVKWKGNHCYTYLFKISDNTNGTSGKVPTDPDDPTTGGKEGLYPITFDALSITSDDYTQETTTTLASNTVTSYAYPAYKAGDSVYVVTTGISDKKIVTPTGLGEDAKKAQVYKVTTTKDAISEATVYAQLTGCNNGLKLTKINADSLKLVYQVPASDGSKYTFGTKKNPAAVKFIPKDAGNYAYVYCTTKYVPAEYESQAAKTYDSTKTYYKKIDGVYTVVTGITSTNWDANKADLYTLKSAEVTGVYDIKVIYIAAK